MMRVSFYVIIKQISTQQNDYLLDTIALHDSMGILRPVFANPSICKVCKLSVSCFHGGDDVFNFNKLLFSSLNLYLFNKKNYNTKL